MFLLLVLVFGLSCLFGCLLVFYFPCGFVVVVCFLDCFLFAWICFCYLSWVLFVCFLFFFCLCVCICLFSFALLFALGFVFIFFFCHVASGVLVSRLGVWSEPLWWEHQVQDTGLTENCRPQWILISVSSSRVPHLILAPRPGSTQLPKNASAGRLRPNNQQDRNTALPIKKKWDDRKIR